MQWIQMLLKLKGIPGKENKKLLQNRMTYGIHKRTIQLFKKFEYLRVRVSNSIKQGAWLKSYIVMGVQDSLSNGKPKLFQNDQDHVARLL